MKFVSMNKVSTVDYPKKIVTTLFTAGCNFRCSYCHNSDLIKVDDTAMKLSEDEILAHLIKRKGVIDGICITGGEPSLWGDDLLEFLRRVKREIGSDFLIKIDTNGSSPDFIRKAVETADFIAMDLKASDYTGFSKTDIETIKESLSLLQGAKDYEIRFTMFPLYIREEDFETIGRLVRGAKKAAIQQFNPKFVYQEEIKNIAPYSNEVLERFREILKKYVYNVEIRGI